MSSCGYGIIDSGTLCRRTSRSGAGSRRRTERLRAHFQHRAECPLSNTSVRYWLIRMQIGFRGLCDRSPWPSPIENSARPSSLGRGCSTTHFAAKLARPHVKAVLTGEGADELFAYVDRPRELADELTRSLGTTRTHNDRLRGECLRDRHLIVAQMDVCRAQ